MCVRVNVYDAPCLHLDATIGPGLTDSSWGSTVPLTPARKWLLLSMPPVQPWKVKIMTQKQHADSKHWWGPESETQGLNKMQKYGTQYVYCLSFGFNRIIWNLLPSPIHYSTVSRETADWARGKWFKSVCAGFWGSLDQGLVIYMRLPESLPTLLDWGIDPK